MLTRRDRDSLAEPGSRERQAAVAACNMTVLVHHSFRHLLLATRDQANFAHPGVDILNPWAD